MLRRLVKGACFSAIVALGCSVLIAAAGDSPVADAAQQGNRDGVRALLTQGADVNAARADGMTALHWAAWRGDAELAQQLIYAGANVAATTRLGSYTPLMFAARNGHPDVVKVLLGAGASPSTTDAYGTTPLMLAAESGLTASLTALLQHGADVNAKESARGETALMFASAYGRTDAVKLLLAHGADWKASTKVLDWTRLPRTDPRLELRLTGGAQPPPDKKKASGQPGTEAARASAAQTPHEAAQQPARGAKAGQANRTANPNAAAMRPPSYVQLVGTQGGLTALMFAARQGYLDTVKALVEAGADVNEINPGDHSTPLLIAIINGRFDTAMYLLDHQADPNLAEANGATALYDVLNTRWAAKTEYPQPQAYKQQQTDYLDLMKALLAHGANPNVRLKEKVWYSGYNRDMSGLDETGATPFWRAAYADDIDAMKLLIAHGADPTVATIKLAGRARGEFGAAEANLDKSGLPAVPVGGPGIPALLAASGEAYGSSFTSNEHRYAPAGMLAAVKYLVEDLHADVNARDADGNTALHNAAARGDNAMILYLVSRGADVRAINRKGQSVADMANGPYQRTQPFPETIALLQKMGAKILNKCVSC
jgi:ankyrin repeat protein